MAVDFGAPEWEFPDFGTMKPGDITRMLYELEAQLAETSARHDRLTKRKAAFRLQVAELARDLGLNALDAVVQDGERKVRYTPDSKDHYSIENQEAFDTWLAETQQRERYFERPVTLRRQVFEDDMRRRHKDGEPLPPGVKRYTELKLGKSSAPIEKRVDFAD